MKKQLGMALVALATTAAFPALASDSEPAMQDRYTDSRTEGRPQGERELSLYARWSDSRLKENVVRLGTGPLGIGIYEYDIFGKRERGVIAQELERVLPQAVITTPSGYKMVRYDLIPGWESVTSSEPSVRKAAFMRWSDRRLKSNVVRVGTL